MGVLWGGEGRRSAGLGRPGPRLGASISGTRGKAAQGPAPENAMRIPSTHQRRVR